MTLDKVYESLGGDYNEVLSRLKSEALIKRLIKMFPEDTSYNTFCIALKQNNIKKAFVAVHSLVGVCKTLGYAKLEQSASAVTEALRGGTDDELTDRMLSAIGSDYEFAVFISRNFAETNNL